MPEQIDIERRPDRWRKGAFGIGPVRSARPVQLEDEPDPILRRLGTGTIFCTGVNLDRCVCATPVDGCFQSHDAVLVEDAATTVPPPFGSDAIPYLVRLFHGLTTKTGAVRAVLKTPTNTGERV